MELTEEDKETIVIALYRRIREVKSLIAEAKQEGKTTDYYEYVLRRLRDTKIKFE